MKKVVLLSLMFAASLLGAKELRVLTIGNSFSADVVDSWLSPMAKENGIQLVIGNAVRGGWGLRGHWTDIAEGNAATEYRKIVNGTYSLTKGCIPF